MSGRLLYSVNPWLKMMLRQKFYADVHYVWCSEQWDCRVLDQQTFSAQIAPSSNPKDIYLSLKDAVERKDKHNDHIRRTKAGLVERATADAESGLITEKAKVEIVTLVDSADIGLWRPILCIIHRELVEEQLQEVAAEHRASLGPEFIVPSLRRVHFDMVEF